LRTRKPKELSMIAKIRYGHLIRNSGEGTDVEEYDPAKDFKTGFPERGKY
jgi:hypothetical protein